ncbi:proteoglycan 3 [Tamandua tetradactyla]|uniref:proteoglycan 3 n=1 Tax=Tamandua tetradactyla TaxID=48850 RepID=UPI0040549D0A
MKHTLILPLLLVTVSALHLKNNASQMESLETETALSLDLEGLGQQEGELALSEKEILSEAEDIEASGYEDGFEDEEDVKSDLTALEEDLQCPREEDTVKLLGSPACKTCHYLLVRTPKRFKCAQATCRRCYRGNLVSIHSYRFNKRILCSVRGLNQNRVWIGGKRRGWFLWWKKFRWLDGSCWNFQNWAPGHPKHGHGSCVNLSTRGGRWRRARCNRRLPFICSY